MQVESSIEADGEVAVVAIAGDFDYTSAEEAEAAMRAAAPDHGALVIDLERCSFVDSTGLATLVHISRDLRERGAAVRVAAPEDSEVRRMLELTGLQLAIELYATAPEAVAAGARPG